MQGIEYYSTSRETCVPFTKSLTREGSWFGQKNKIRKIPDDLAATEQLVLQKDLTFGEYIYRYLYFADETRHRALFVKIPKRLKYSILTRRPGGDECCPCSDYLGLLFSLCE